MTAAPVASSTDIARGMAVYCADSPHNCADYQLGTLAALVANMLSNSWFERDYARSELAKIAELGRGNRERVR